MVLKWNKKQYRKSFPICSKGARNIVIMVSTTGNHKHITLCNQHNASSPALGFTSTIDFNSEATIAPAPENKSLLPDDHTKESKYHPILINFDDELDATDCHPAFNDNIQEYMHWHYPLNHASFTTMYNLARLKLLAQLIASFIKTMHKTNHKPPLCSNCISAKACRKQGRQKPTHNTTN
jgi:hypothetical protein